MSLLRVQHLSKSFAIESGVWRQTTGHVQALSDVSFDISAGETVALVGGSGSGKTTLAKIIAGLWTPDQGEVSWEGRPAAAFSRREWAHQVQMIFQDPYASLNPKLTIETQLRDVMRSPSAEGLARALTQVQLEPARVLQAYPHQFSGGQRQRIAIARALAAEPRLLIADEPLSALDVTTQAQILALFESLQKALGLTFLLITHDLGIAHRFAQRVLVLQEGRVVEQGPSAEILRRPQHPYTKSLLAAVPAFPC